MRLLSEQVTSFLFIPIEDGTYGFSSSELLSATHVGSPSSEFMSVLTDLIDVCEELVSC